VKEIVLTCPIFASDLEKVKDFQERKKMKRLADALRVAIEFTIAHGGYT
jgi:hypothetical protein